MTENKKHSGNLTLLGGKKCLDFINTLDWRGKDRPVEYLNSYEDVIRWAAYVKIINPKEEKYFSKQAVMNIKKTEEALKITIELRELLHKMFLYIQQGKRIQKQNLSRLNGFLQKTYISTVIKPCTKTDFGKSSPSERSTAGQSNRWKRTISLPMQ